MELCKCNMCDTILEDKNPQINAPEYIKGANQSLIWDEAEQSWVCPICKTDGYLIDL